MPWRHNQPGKWLFPMLTIHDSLSLKSMRVCKKALPLKMTETGSVITFDIICLELWYNFDVSSTVIHCIE